MSKLRVEINYEAVATLLRGIQSQIEREDINGLRGSVKLLTRLLDKAAITAAIKKEKNEKFNNSISNLRASVARAFNRICGKL